MSRCGDLRSVADHYMDTQGAQFGPKHLKHSRAAGGGDPKDCINIMRILQTMVS